MWWALSLLGGLAAALDPNSLTDANDRAYNLPGSSYFRPLWFYDFAQSSGIWYQNQYQVYADRATGLGGAVPLSPANGALTLTEYSASQTVHQNAVFRVYPQDLLVNGTGDNIRVRMKIKLGSTRTDSTAGSGLGVYYMRRSEYDELNVGGQAFNWHSRCEANKPQYGLGVCLRTRRDTEATAVNGFSIRLSTSQTEYNDYEQNPTSQQLRSMAHHKPTLIAYHSGMGHS